MVYVKWYLEKGMKCIALIRWKGNVLWFWFGFECFGFELSVTLSLIKLKVMQTYVYLPPLSFFSTG